MTLATRFLSECDSVNAVDDSGRVRPRLRSVDAKRYAEENHP